MFIDLAKGFDSVPHEHRVLEQRGLDQHVMELLRDSSRNCVTKLEVGGALSLSQMICMNSGVKHGDPLSPLLFNLAIDPLIRTPERDSMGFSMDGISISTLAFADNLVLLRDSWLGMVHNLNILDAFCELSGFQIQPAKCHGFLIQNVCGIVSVNACPTWRVGDTDLRFRSIPGSGSQGVVWGFVRSIQTSKLRASQSVRLLVDYAQVGVHSRSLHDLKRDLEGGGWNGKGCCEEVAPPTSLHVMACCIPETAMAFCPYARTFLPR